MSKHQALKDTEMMTKDTVVVAFEDSAVVDPFALEGAVDYFAEFVVAPVVAFAELAEFVEEYLELAVA
jgi:hypothetical protein